MTAVPRASRHWSAASGTGPKRAIARGHNYILRKKRGLSITSPHAGFMQVDGCGAGVLLIARTAIETMLQKMPDLSDPTAKANSPLAANLDRLIRAFEPLRVNGALLSEDFSFCHRWNACGGEVWVNTAHEIEHIGLHRFKGRYSDLGPQQLSLEKPQQVRVTERAAQPKPRVTQRVKVVTGPSRK